MTGEAEAGRRSPALEGTVDPQRYYLLWKRSRDGAYRMSSLYLPAPPKKN